MTRRAVAGKSLLTTASKLLSPSRGVRFWQFETVMAFAEAYVLHGGITILASRPEQDTDEGRFVDLVNQRRPGAIDFLDLEDLDRSLVDRRMADITERVLGRRLTTGDVDTEVRGGWHDGDDANNFCTRVRDAIEGSQETLAEGLREAVNHFWDRGTGRNFANHLMRGFVLASVAHEVRGSAVLTGYRRPVRMLLRESAPEIHLETTAQSLYRIADSVLVVRQPTPDPQDIERAFRAGLIPWSLLRSRGFGTDWPELPGLGEALGGRRLGHLLARLDLLREDWRALLALGERYDAAEVWRPWQNPTVGPIRASARRREVERQMARLAHRQPFSAGERFVQTVRDMFGGQQSVSDPSALSDGVGRVAYPIQVILNVLSMALPSNIGRRRAFFPLLWTLARTNAWPAPSRAAFTLFGIDRVDVGGRSVPRDQTEIAWSNALTYSEARLRLGRLLPQRGPTPD